MRHIVIAALAAASLTTPVAAQPTVIHTATSTIEIIGLKQWTVKMIENSLEKYGQDKLTAHACAAILRGKLHFADASVTMYSNFPEFDFKPYVAITVVEPVDSAKIHYKSWKFDRLQARAEWAEAFAQFKTSNELAQGAIQTESFYAEHLSAADSTKYVKLDALHRVIVSSRSPADFTNAARTIETDSVMANRVIATLILGNFADRDSAWWTLVDAQRDPTWVSSTASQVLNIMGRRSPRVVDWTPVAGRLRYLLDGTNLFAFNPTMKTLTTTGVSPALAAALL
ncbi:MAG: hypothetical protein ACREBE_28580, partial [bacterium]